LQSSATTMAITVQYADGSTATAQLSPKQLAAASSSYALGA
jgi:hypothetical protein